MASLRRNAHPRAAVSDDAPLTAGLALRRRLARCPVRLSARQSMIRSAASLRRVPWGRFPDFIGTISGLRLLDPRPAALRFLRLAVPRGCPVRSRGSGPLPGPGLLFIAAVRAASPVETSRPPRFLGDPCLHAPLSDPGGTACARPSRRRDAAFRSCHSVGFRDVYGFRGSITQPARLPVYASQPGSPPVHATLGSGWSVNLGRSGLSPAGSHRRFLSCHNMPSPFTKLRLAQEKPVPLHGT